MTIKTMVLAAAVLAMGAGVALAQNGPPPAVVAAWRPAAMTRRSSVPTRPVLIARACMEANKDKLSDACKAARAARASGGGQ